MQRMFYNMTQILNPLTPTAAIWVQCHL